MPRKNQTEQGLQKAPGIVNPLGKRLYTLKEAAVYLGRSDWGVRELIWSRTIPVIQQPGARKYYLDIRDLDMFIEKNKSLCN
jgi:excisionase family DNA binding protein